MSDMQPAPTAPATPPASPPPDQSHLDDTPAVDVNWEALSSTLPGEDDQGDTTPPPSTPATPASPEPAPAPAPAPTPEPQVPPVPPSQPAPQPTPAPVAPSPQPPAPAPQPTLTPEQQQAQAQAFKDNFIKNLAQHNATTLTEDDKRELLTSPETVLPRLMAQATFDGMQVATALMQEQMRTQMPRIVEQSQASRNAEANFFAANPDLQNPAFRSTVTEMAATARKLNPKATGAEIAVRAASMARAALGLPAQGAAPGAPAAAPAAPARPFTPAAAGGSPAAPASGAKPVNVWEDLARDD